MVSGSDRMSSLRATVEMPISSQAPGPLSASATLATTTATSSSALIAADSTVLFLSME